MTDPLDSLDTHQIWESVPDALLVIDPSGKIVVTNHQSCELFGYPDGMAGLSVESLVPPESTASHIGFRKAFHEQPHRRAMGAGARLEALRADASRFPVQISLSPLGEDDLVIAAVRDITDVATTEERLVESARRRILAEDHERIAKDMHDTVIQELFALGMSLQTTAAVATERDTAERLEESVTTLDDVIRSIRSLIFDIRSDQRRTDDLRTQVVEIATSLIPSLGFEPSVAFFGALDRVPDQLHDHVLAAIRESLTNVARHADATAAAINVAASDQEVTVTVVDDGVGVPKEPQRRSGLANLDERARLARGSFKVEAHPEGGTTVVWSCPVVD